MFWIPLGLGGSTPDRSGVAGRGFVNIRRGCFCLQWEHFAHGVHNHCPRVITVLGRFFAVALRIRNCYGCYLRVYGHTH